MADRLPPLSCCICGNTSCAESYDHNHLTTDELCSLLQTNRAQHPKLSELYSKVDNYYKTLISRFTEMLMEDQRKIVQALRKFEFPNMDREKVSMELLVGLSNGDFSALPTRKLIPILDVFNRPKGSKSTLLKISPAELLLCQQTTPHSIQSKLTLLRQSLPLLHPLINEQHQKNQSIHRTISIRKLYQFEETVVPHTNSFEFKGIRCSESSREIMLNNRSILDAEMFQPVEKMRWFPNLTSLELRNNRLTEVSCRLLAVSLRGLQRLDIRGNRLGESAFRIIARGLTNLTELYVCDNELSDESLQAIVEGIKGLTLIWLTNNKVTYRGAQLIIHHSNMKAIGLNGNNITEQEGEWLKSQFTLGYLSI